jgi:hypothetical protein
MGDFDQSQLAQDMCTINPQDTGTYLNWGKLVKTWATSVNQFNNNKDYSIPAAKEPLRTVGVLTKDQFQSMLRNANVKMSIPDRVTKFVFVQDDASTVIVRLPKGKVVENVQRLLEGVSDSDDPRYPLPGFYRQFFEGNWVAAMDKEAILNLHCRRIGEYTINTCG